MKSVHKKHSPEIKANVALELIKGADTISTICSRYQIHPSQGHRWKQTVLENIKHLFGKKKQTELAQKNQLIEELYKQVGQLKVELDWVKKKSEMF